ncbi:uracil phosphoribosyltransferase homolog [Onychostruthus taczanowskii]|uniref:uracil phosphoribosyltransferase homolog n=1 Tax=Onychostruthus taczanowskii TaxID=356909 RepID=UPI001B80998E|nr:uracil phosphoribosyltransferase homolog [Onychostruthus taczanowskii]
MASGSAMPCQNQRLGPRPQDEPPAAATATASGGSRLIRFAEPSEDSGCPSPDSSSSSSNGVVAAPVPAGEGGAPAIGPQLKLLPMNDQLRELQTIIRDKKSSRGDFVFSADRLIRLVVEEGLNQLPYTECTVTTPTGHKYEGVRFEKGNCGVSIMRSGRWCWLLKDTRAKSIIQEFPDITILTTEVHPVAPTHFGQKYFGTD